jgi:hypothetical protein
MSIRASILFLMVIPILIVSVEQDGIDGVIVRFSDGTAAGYVVEELLGLRPISPPLALSPLAPVVIPNGTA